MKLGRFSPALLFVTLLAVNDSRAALINVPGLYNTGVDDSGNVLPLGSVDPHYVVSGASDTAFIAPIVFHSPGSQAWVTPPGGAAWIGPNNTDNTWPTDPTGNYYYDLRITLDLKNLDPAKLQISGEWATDNSGQIWVNGQDTGFNTIDWGFSQLSSFLLQDVFTPGINTLEFRVLNSGGSPNPSGLLVADLQAADDGTLTLPNPASPVPEPSTFIAGALLALPLGFHALRSLTNRKAWWRADIGE